MKNRLQVKTAYFSRLSCFFVPSIFKMHEPDLVHYALKEEALRL